FFFVRRSPLLCSLSSFVTYRKTISFSAALAASFSLLAVAISFFYSTFFCPFFSFYSTFFSTCYSIFFSAFFSIFLLSILFVFYFLFCFLFYFLFCLLYRAHRCAQFLVPLKSFVVVSCHPLRCHGT